MQDHTKTFWFHSIHIGNGVVTQGVKSAEALKSHFDLFGFNSEFLRGRRVLDIRCNDGYMSLQCARLGADVTGIDGVFRDSLKYVRACRDQVSVLLYGFPMSVIFRARPLRCYSVSWGALSHDISVRTNPASCNGVCDWGYSADPPQIFTISQVSRMPLRYSTITDSS
jgi:hypothetical protein